MILPATNGVDKDVDDLYGDQFTVALARAASALECAPYWHSGEKAPSRLARAQELIRHSRVILHDERLATVHGSSKAYDVTGYHCTCPQSQKGQSSWCVHAVGVKLARVMAAQAPREEALPLGPTSVEERLAQAASVAMDHVYDALPTPLEDRPAFNDEDAEARDLERRQRNYTQASLPPTAADDDPQFLTPHTPQEARMADDAYIPEPDTEDAPVAVLAPAERKERKKGSAPAPCPARCCCPPSMPARWSRACRRGPINARWSNASSRRNWSRARIITP